MNTSKKSGFLARLSEYEGAKKYSVEEGRALSETPDRLEKEDLLAISQMSVGRPKTGEEREESEVFSVRLPKSIVQKLRILAERMNLTRNRLAAIAFQRQVVDPISEEELKLVIIKRSWQSYIFRITRPSDLRTQEILFQSITAYASHEMTGLAREDLFFNATQLSSQYIKLKEMEGELKPEIPKTPLGLMLAGACE